MGATSLERAMSSFVCVMASGNLDNGTHTSVVIPSCSGSSANTAHNAALRAAHSLSRLSLSLDHVKSEPPCLFVMVRAALSRCAGEGCCSPVQSTEQAHAHQSGVGGGAVVRRTRHRVSRPTARSVRHFRWSRQRRSVPSPRTSPASRSGAGRSLRTGLTNRRRTR